MPRILVIDDEPMIRSTVVTILTREGFSVKEASDGVAGIALVHKHSPDVVITDIFMPNRDGIEIIRELERSWPRTKIITKPGGGQMRIMEIASVAQFLGADHTLHKPFERESLLAAVNAVIGTPPPPRSQHGV
jgi:DNA-binding response OmpR family regulator